MPLTGAVTAAFAAAAATALAAGLAIDELEVLDDDAVLGSVLTGFFVLPGVELKSPFDEDGATFAEVLL